MAQSKSQNAGGAENHGLSSRDLKELEKFSNLIISRETELGRKSTEIKQMGDIGHWWDAKVPEEDKCWYNFVSLKTSTDKNVMSRDVQNYKDFCCELKGAVGALRQAMIQDKKVKAEEILELFERLSRMVDEAESGQETTNSSTVYGIHGEFLRSRDLLENAIKRVECVALRQQLKKVTADWTTALEKIDNISSELEGVKQDKAEMQTKLDNITAVNEEMAEKQKKLLQQNALITQCLRELLGR